MSGGERPVASAEHAIHVLDVIEAARLAASEARHVAIPPARPQRRADRDGASR